MKTMLIAAGLLLFAVSGILFLNTNPELGGWFFLISCFAGMGTAILGFTYKR